MKQTVTIAIVLLLMSALGATTAYVVNSNSQTLSSIDLQTGEVNNDFATLGQAPGTAPNKLALTEDYAYVVITYENSVQKIALDGSGSSFIALEDSSLPNDIALYGGFGYVSGNGSNKVYKIDLATDAAVAELAVGTAPQGVLVHNGMLLVANTGFDIATYTYEPGTVSVIDLTDFTLSNSLDVGLNPADFTITDDEIHVVCTGDFATQFGVISILDATDFTVADNFFLGGSPASISASTDGTVYCGNAWPAGVYAYNASTHVVEITPDDGIFTGGNAVLAQGGTLAVVDAADYVQNSTIRIYDEASQQLLNEYEVGVGATDIAYAVANSATPHTLAAPSAWVSNFPNPFNPSTEIKFSVDTTIHGSAAIQIYNTRGQMVNELTLNNTQLQNGSTTWNGLNAAHQSVASGLYFYRLVIGGTAVAQNRMMLLK
jgi:DNA-binding beta-propeller fold protein YncE